jgi:sterol desaturase/sphingolipid hydroxylase (fatty acid hydroxylase superfamily)
MRLESGMEFVTYVFAVAITPIFYPLSAVQRIFWLYLLSALALAILVYAFNRTRSGSGGTCSLLGFLFPRKVFTHASAIVDYKYFFVNRFAFALVIAPILIAAPTIAEFTATMLGLLAGEGGLGVSPGAADHLLYTLCMILALDGAIFYAHFLQHKVPFLWEFHKVHHSARVLTPITVYRMHPVDDILTGTVLAIFTGVADGVFSSIYAATPTKLVLFNLNIILFLFYMAGYNLRHSYIWLSYPKAVSHLLVSPAQHQIHHSSHPKHFEKNLGFIFAFWDALMGTLYVPKEHESLDFGLMDDEHRAFDSVWALYARPFSMLWRDHLPRWRRST